MWTIAAEAAGIEPTAAFVAIIGCVAGVLGAVLGVMFKVSSAADQRVDAASRASLERLVADLQIERGETLAAEKDRDAWRDKATKLQIDNAALRSENRRLKGEA